MTTKKYQRQTLQCSPRETDISGRRFGRLLALAKIAHGKYREPTWNCLCDCGTFSQVQKYSLTRGTTTSCGCFSRGLKNTLTHGMSKTRTYASWARAITRCYNPKDKGYKNYGGRGITMCREWREDFEVFFKDMGEKPVGLSLGRIDNNLGYFAKNCRWETVAQQNSNTRKNRFFTFNGETKTMTEWARSVGISHKILWDRINSGWPIERGLTEPLRIR